MEIKDILEIIDSFFNKKQKEIKNHVEEFGKDKNRDIDSREKSMLLTLPMGYKNQLKEMFIKKL